MGFIAATTYDSAGTQGTTVTLPKPAGTTEGDLLIASIGVRGSPLSVTPPAGWTLVRSTGRLFTYRKTATASEPSSYAFTVGNSQYHTGSLCTYRGILDIRLSAGTSGTADSTNYGYTAPSVTAESGDILLCTWVIDHGGGEHLSATTAPGMVERADAAAWAIAHSVDDESRTAGATGTRRVELSAAGGNAEAAAHSLLLIPNVAPNAPTNLSPNGVTFDKDVTQRFSWTPSDPDPGDTQSKYDLRYRAVGTGTWTTVTATTSNTFRDFPAGTFAAEDYEWQVRTYDALGAVGPWSSSTFFTAATTPPGPTITDPVNGQTIPSADYTGTISYPDMDSWEWRVLGDDGGNPDETDVIIPATTRPSTTRTFHMQGLPNDTIVHPQVRVLAGGLWSQWVSSSNPVSFTPPAVAGVSIEQDYPAGAISVQAIHLEPTGGQPVAVAVDWWRREVDADGVPLVEGDTGIPHVFGRQLAAGQVFRDWWITASQHYAYRGRVHGDNGTTSWTPWISTDDDTPPLAPSGLAFTTDNDTSLTVTWLATLDDDTDQADLRYGVYRDGVLLTITDPGVTTFADSDLTPGVGYVYEISAIDQAGNTATSDPLPASTFTPLPLTLPALLG